MPEATTPEQCRHCWDYAPIALHCARCGNAVCVECVLDIEQETGLCWRCEAIQRSKRPRRKGAA